MQRHCCFVVQLLAHLFDLLEIDRSLQAIVDFVETLLCLLLVELGNDALSADDHDVFRLFAGELRDKGLQSNLGLLRITHSG